MNENHLFHGMGITNFSHKSDLKKIMPSSLIKLLDAYKFLDPLRIGPPASGLSDCSIECSDEDEYTKYH